MKNNFIKKYNAEKATVCADKTCVTVYGETAKAINTVAVFAVFFVAIAVVAKAIR
jgi:hypothetical protein